MVLMLKFFVTLYQYFQAFMNTEHQSMFDLKLFLSDVPSQQSRFLGDVSGLAEYSDLGVIVYYNIIHIYFINENLHILYSN